MSKYTFMPTDLVTDQRMIDIYMSMKEEIEDELDDPRYKQRWHGRPIGKNNGCKGPLCRKDQRDRVRPLGTRNISVFRDTLIEVMYEIILKERADLKMADERARFGGAAEADPTEETETVA